MHEKRRSLGRALAGAAVTVSAALAGCGGAPEPAGPELTYASEYPEMRYAARVPEGVLGRLAQRVAAGEAALGYDSERGYLDSVLAALDIDPSSQVLVFSKTSQQVGSIGPETPRAIYFNDETYVAWIPDARTLELAGYDSSLGPVFYTLQQEAGAAPAMEREFRACLRCHDSYSMTGGGVPRFLLGSGYTGTAGELVSHEAWILTGTATPFRSRWGGWYVTGHHGDAVHLGNIVVERPEDLQDLESLRVGNVSELSGFFDTSRYPSAKSDIVALMVLEHQVEVQNLISRLRFESAGRSLPEDGAALDAHVDALARALVMADEVRLPSPVEGSSGFAAHFESLGPFDSAGRSLRELDLQTRFLRYPLSYLVYSEGFLGLPEDVRQAVYGSVWELIAASPADDRDAVAEILRETLPAALD